MNEYEYEHEYTAQYIPVGSLSHLGPLLPHQWPSISSDTCLQPGLQTVSTEAGPRKTAATRKTHKV